MTMDLELRGLVVEHFKAVKELLWSKIYDTYRCLNDLSDLAADKGNFEIIVNYLNNLAATEPDYRQFISVKNADIDIVLQRYMLEAATLNIIVDFDIDNFQKLSVESTISVVKALESFFAKTLDLPKNSHIFLHIKENEGCIHLYADHVAERIFDETLELA